MISNKANKSMIQEVLEDFARTGIAKLKESLEKLFNQLMIAEREDYIGASPYARTPEGEKVEQALRLALAEAYVQGVSTRKMKALTEELCGKEISSTQVSRCTKVLDEEVGKFKNRLLGSYCYLYLDAQYEKVRYEGAVRLLSILKAVGVTQDGIREVLGVSCSLSEAEVHWREFLESLIQRGMRGLKLVINDGHAGLKKPLCRLCFGRGVCFI